MAAIAIGAMLVFSVAGIQAFADTVEADTVDASTNSVTIQPGESVTVNYRIIPNRVGESGDPNTDPQPGCNAADGSSATVTIDAPSGITADKSTLTFDRCNRDQAVTYTAPSTTANGEYTITVSVSDSGTQEGEYYTGDAVVTLTVQAASGGGGGGEEQDLTPPEISYTLTPSTPDGSSGWYKSDVTIDWTVTDDESEPTIDSGCEDQTITADTDSSGVTLSCEAHSDGGAAEPVSVTIKKDGTAPTVSLVGGDNGIAAGGSYFFGFVPSKPTCDASDPTPGSGLDGECTVDGYGDSVGEHTVKATANDIAGNTGESESITYTVKKWDLRGFTQPVDMGSTVNTVKGGSTVPFKFEIFADTEFTSTTFNGNPIGAFSAKKVSCTTGGEDAIEQVVTATGGTALRYDTTSGQFVYNWQTPKGAGICYDTTFTDQSGATLTAHFKTK
jgi:hypothetical protein